MFSRGWCRAELNLILRISLQMHQAQIGHHSKDRSFLEAVVDYVVSHGPDSAGSRNRTERKGGGIHSRGGRQRTTEERKRTLSGHLQATRCSTVISSTPTILILPTSVVMCDSHMHITLHCYQCDSNLQPWAGAGSQFPVLKIGKLFWGCG